MAKSTRSKVKRTFRRDKREAAASAYHAVDAARLARLSAKLRAKFEDTPAAAAAADSTETEMRDVDDGESSAGWLELAIFGLIDQDAIGFASSSHLFWCH
jgi:hypothetical protein